MQIDTTLGGLDSAGQSAAAAEAAGYDGVFTGELNNDPFLPLVLAAASTEHIDIGTALAIAFSRSPMTWPIRPMNSNDSPGVAWCWDSGPRSRRTSLDGSPCRGVDPPPK
jgi:hypothetical protein